MLCHEICGFIQIYRGKGYFVLITEKTGAQLLFLLCLLLGTMICAEVIFFSLLVCIVILKTRLSDNIFDTFLMKNEPSGGAA